MNIKRRRVNSKTTSNLKQVADEPKPRPTHDAGIEECDQDLTRADKKPRTKKPIIHRNRIEKDTFDWDPAQQEAFNMVEQAICTNAMARADPNLQYHLATDASVNALGECQLQISGQPAVNQKLPVDTTRPQWEALSQDPEALMRMPNKVGELRSGGLKPVRLESTLCEAFFQRFVDEIGKTLRLHLHATTAEDARMKASRVNWAHENHTRLSKEKSRT